ncbi:hypothetical protein NRL37_21005 [Metapseudomonas otitidis]|uniref:hypothetical protein n=1 Tax=Metapseudomonas otitidis TaxID=319939 RepID=UPI00227D3403|nr:hypothetical protein [Pseudomonas otitidis]WAF84550.1 hypothetical protein NRL37_21005 [Pseudomonas otitidis]
MSEITLMHDVIQKRVLLAKEFHLSGIDNAQKKDPLSKMMAVHNFHISIEIAVKSILLKYEIRSEKTLNIDFESMLNEVDQFEKFKSKGIKLPYRQEIRNLNLMRNMVQHHVIEPDESSMDDWRLFSYRFLKRVFNDYFGMDFDRASRISFINDEGLRMYLEKAQEQLDSSDYSSASCLLAGAFEYASISISSFIPKSSSEFFITSRLGHTGSTSTIKDAFKETLKRVNEVEHFSVLLASGVSLSDYKKYKDSSPFAQIMLAGNIIYQTHAGKVFDKDSTTWQQSFVVNTVIKWQQLGLSPQIPEHLKDAAIKSLTE